jgi:hypothetical protein
MSIAFSAVTISIGSRIETTSVWAFASAAFGFCFFAIF